MNKNEKFVITINRELGSGGRTVGRLLAENLGVEFYDKALIKGLEEKYNLTVEEIEKLKGSKKNWWADFTRVVSVGPAIISTYSQQQKSYGTSLPTTAEMFKAESEILRGIADNESCVVAGRSGFFVLRNHPNHLSILIQASMPYRVERLCRKQGLSKEEARKIIDQVAKMRENYVKKYTDTSRYDTRNYDVVITMDGLSEEYVADLILDYFNQRCRETGSFLPTNG